MAGSQQTERRGSCGILAVRPAVCLLWSPPCSLTAGGCCFIPYMHSASSRLAVLLHARRFDDVFSEEHSSRPANGSLILSTSAWSARNAFLRVLGLELCKIPIQMSLDLQWHWALSTRCSASTLHVSIVLQANVLGGVSPANYLGLDVC